MSRFHYHVSVQKRIQIVFKLSQIVRRNIKIIRFKVIIF